MWTSPCMNPALLSLTLTALCWKDSLTDSWLSFLAWTHLWKVCDFAKLASCFVLFLVTRMQIWVILAWNEVFLPVSDALKQQCNWTYAKMPRCVTSIYKQVTNWLSLLFEMCWHLTQVCSTADSTLRSWWRTVLSRKKFLEMPVKDLKVVLFFTLFSWWLCMRHQKCWSSCRTSWLSKRSTGSMSCLSQLPHWCVLMGHLPYSKVQCSVIKNLSSNATLLMSTFFECFFVVINE